MIHSSPPTATPLFGGAISAFLPPELIDISNYRQVPDNQEVWVDHSPTTIKHSDSQADSISVIIEILELLPDINVDDMATFHLTHMIEDDSSDSTTYSVHNVSSVAECECSISQSGYPVVIRRVIAFMRGTKFRSFYPSQQPDMHDIIIILWVIRLPHITTDIVITWNLPIGVMGPGLPGLPDAPREVISTVISSDILARCEVVVKSLKVIDWSLFC